MGEGKAKLRARHFVVLDIGSKLTLVHGHGAREFAGRKASKVRSSLRLAPLIGTRGETKIKASNTLRQTLGTLLTDCNLLFDPRARQKVSRVSGDDVAQAIEAARAMWKPMLPAHPLFQWTQKDPVLMVYFLLEYSVFVSQVPVALQVAISSARGRASYLRSMLKRLYREERDHYQLLIKDLGLSEREFCMHDPDPATTALVAHLTALAATDTESFLISSLLFEADPEDVSTGARFYAQAEKKTGLGLKKFAQHQADDNDLAHANNWRTVVLAHRNIEKAKASKWISDLHTTKHMIELWYDGLLAKRNDLRKLSRRYPLDPVTFLRPKPQFDSIAPEEVT